MEAACQDSSLQTPVGFVVAVQPFSPPVLLTGYFYWHPDDMCRVRIEQQTCNKSRVWFFSVVKQHAAEMLPLSLISSAANTQKKSSFGFGIGFHLCRRVCYPSVCFPFLASQKPSSEESSSASLTIISDLWPFSRCQIKSTFLTSKQCSSQKSEDHGGDLHFSRLQPP